MTFIGWELSGEAMIRCSRRSAVLMYLPWGVGTCHYWPIQTLGTPNLLGAIIGYLRIFSSTTYRAMISASSLFMPASAMQRSDSSFARCFFTLFIDRAGHLDMPKSRQRCLNVVPLQPSAAQASSRGKWNIVFSFSCNCTSEVFQMGGGLVCRYIMARIGLSTLHTAPTCRRSIGLSTAVLVLALVHVGGALSGRGTAAALADGMGASCTATSQKSWSWSCKTSVQAGSCM